MRTASATTPTRSPGRSHSRFLALALAVAAASAGPAAGVARAQDTGGGEAAAPAVDPSRAETILQRMESAYARAVERPAPVDYQLPVGSEERAKDTKRFARDDAAWKSALAALPELSLDYREAAGEAAAPVAWYYSGFARVVAADTKGRTEGRELITSGVEDLRAYLERAPKDAPYRADAEHHLAYGLLRLAAGEASGILAAAEHADVAVRAHLAAGRADDAGRLAFQVLEGLVSADHESDAAALAAGWQADAADFGVSTDSVRKVVRRTRIRPGAPMPALPALDAVTGGPMPWKELAGKPYVLHFFSTVVSTSPREIETILVPLRDKWAAKGLRLVGCSTDRAMSDEELAKRRAQWEEWGKKEPLHDGRLASVRDWAENRGVDWPWYWDGEWTRNALVEELGVPVNAPFAILVDAKGTIRWRGQPFQGLAEAVDELLQ